jgi:ribosome-associated translation inhibitor RaiA
MVREFCAGHANAWAALPDSRAIMKSTFRYNSVNNRGAWPPLFAQMLAHLHGLTTITSTDVVLEHQRGAKPAYRVQVRLNLPGAGMHGAGSDDILEEAVLKATHDLERQIQARQTKPLDRAKSPRQPGAVSPGTTGRKA